MKKSILLSLILFPAIISAAVEETKREAEIELLQLTHDSFIAPRDLGAIDVLYFDGKFVVMKDGNLQPIENYNVCSDLRNISSKDFKKFLYEYDGYLIVNKKSDGAYTLDGRLRLPGGAFWGATLGAFLGRAIVYTVGYGTIYIVSIATGPAAPVTRVVLNRMASPFIHAASNVAAVAGGVALGAASGPI